jgi:hypothetical protein
VIFEPVADEKNMAAMLRVRREVFERENGLGLARLSELDRPGAFHWQSFIDEIRTRVTPQTGNLANRPIS